LLHAIIKSRTGRRTVQTTRKQIMEARMDLDNASGADFTFSENGEIKDRISRDGSPGGRRSSHNCNAIPTGSTHNHRLEKSPKANAKDFGSAGEQVGERLPVAF
jgi:hypothetical protein